MLGKWARRRLVADIIDEEFEFRTDKAAFKVYDQIIVDGIDEGDNPHDSATRIALDTLNCLHYHCHGEEYAMKFRKICAGLKEISPKLSVTYSSVIRNVTEISMRERGSEFTETVIRELT